MESKPRFIEFDIIKCLAIYLVLWGHSLLHLSECGKSNLAYVIINMFHMPLFMLISGFFSKKAIDYDLKILTINKFFQLIYPCISFGVLFVLIDIVKNLFMGNGLTLSVYPGFIYSSFWFLKCLFICFILLKIFLGVFKNKYCAIIAALILSQIIPLFKINWMFPFFVLGYVMNNKMEYIKKSSGVIFIISILSFIFGSIYLFDEASTWSQSIQEVKAELRIGNYGIFIDYLLIQLKRIVLGFLGAMACISGILSMTKIILPKVVTEFLSTYGKSTLGIYIIQTLLLETILAQSLDFSDMPEWIYTFVLTPVISLVCMIVCKKLSDLISNHKTTSKLMWGK